MRSSKPRPRSKNNRNNNNRSVANVMNRVFDSSGPEGKVRGTPQQIIEKYQQLTRDCQLSGDRVAAENFQQHAEHYTRLQADAQREIDARREQQDRENREKQALRDQERNDRPERVERPENNDRPQRGPDNINQEKQTETVTEEVMDFEGSPQPDLVPIQSPDMLQKSETVVPHINDRPKPRVRRRSSKPTDAVLDVEVAQVSEHKD